MRRFGRLTGLGVLLLIACGGTKPAPPKSTPAPNALAKEPSDKPDLSPVAAPAELFLVGRVKRPGPILDTLGKWAGFPGSLRMLVGQELHGLGSLMAWDAPIEVAVMLPARGRRKAVRAVVSVGLNSVGGMVNAARERGLSPERILPEVFGFAGPSGLSCVVGPSLGSSNARLVCGERAGEVEELFAYATRGLPNENPLPIFISIIEDSRFVDPPVSGQNVRWLNQKKRRIGDFSCARNTPKRMPFFTDSFSPVPLP
jgi:hypothetical protein